MGADADKPVVRLQIDTRAYGPLVCEHCDSEDEDNGEKETALLMEDGGVVCEDCRTPFKAFEQFSGIITSVGPVKLRGAGHVCGDRCRERGCKYSFPQEQENPGSGDRFVVVTEDDEIVERFRSKVSAERFAEKHNEDRHPNTMEYFVKEED